MNTKPIMKIGKKCQSSRCNSRVLPNSKHLDYPNFCTYHRNKLKGVVKKDKCEMPECNIRSSFGMSSDLVLRRCLHHKTSDMINLNLHNITIRKYNNHIDNEIDCHIDNQIDNFIQKYIHMKTNISKKIAIRPNKIVSSEYIIDKFIYENYYKIKEILD